MTRPDAGTVTTRRCRSSPHRYRTASRRSCSSPAAYKKGSSCRSDGRPCTATPPAITTARPRNVWDNSPVGAGLPGTDYSARILIPLRRGKASDDCCAVTKRLRRHPWPASVALVHHRSGRYPRQTAGWAAPPVDGVAPPVGRNSRPLLPARGVVMSLEFPLVTILEALRPFAGVDFHIKYPISVDGQTSRDRAYQRERSAPDTWRFRRVPLSPSGMAPKGKGSMANRPASCSDCR